MKKLLTTIVVFPISLMLFSQKNKKVQKVNDTCWQYQYYAMRGPMIRSEQFKNKEGKLAHGVCSFMRPDGTLDSTGHFVDGKPHGIWRYFDTSGTLVCKKEFARGELISTPDISNDTSIDVRPPDVEARLPGKPSAWSIYLIKNLRYPKYAQDNGIQGHIIIYFLIDEKGNVHNEMVLKSVEYTLDNEALRLIRESPKWMAAVKNGSAVKSYKKQAVTFRVGTSTR